jgi:hypothetical protein
MIQNPKAKACGELPACSTAPSQLGERGLLLWKFLDVLPSLKGLVLACALVLVLLVSMCSGRPIPTLEVLRDVVTMLKE